MTLMNRRQALRLSAKGLAGLMATFPLLKACAHPMGPEGSEPTTVAGDGPAPIEPGPIDWEDFLSQVGELAEIQFSPDWNQEAYVEDVRQLMARLNLEDPFLIQAYADYADQVRDFPEITQVHHEPTFEVTILEFEEGEFIPLHDHPDMTGVIMCVSGTVDVENFTLLEEPAEDSEFLLQRTAQTRMRSLDIGTLTSRNSNIHSLKALEFTQMLDVFTPPYNDDRSNRSRWFRRAVNPLPGRDEIFAAWER